MQKGIVVKSISKKQFAGSVLVNVGFASKKQHRLHATGSRKVIMSGNISSGSRHKGCCSGFSSSWLIEGNHKHIKVIVYY